jgi:hypothetical protein
MPIFAAAKMGVASNAAELRRYAKKGNLVNYSFLVIFVGYLVSLAIMWGTFGYNSNEASSILFIPILLLAITMVSLFVSFMCVKIIKNSFVSFLASIASNNLIYVLAIAIYTLIYDGKAGFNGWLFVAIVFILAGAFPIAFSSWLSAKIWLKKNISA